MRQELCTFDDLVNGVTTNGSRLVICTGSLDITLGVEKITLIEDECRALKLNLEGSNDVIIYEDDDVITRVKSGHSEGKDWYYYRIVDTGGGIYVITGN